MVACTGESIMQKGEGVIN